MTPRLRRFGLLLAGATALGAAAARQPGEPGEPGAGVRNWVAANQRQVVTELVDLLRIPNVADDRANIRRNAEHLHRMLGRRGFTVELLETAGNPLVYGELVVPGATRTVLFYSHYDGQPVRGIEIVAALLRS